MRLFNPPKVEIPTNLIGSSQANKFEVPLTAQDILMENELEMDDQQDLAEFSR